MGTRSYRAVTLLGIYRPGSAVVTSELFDDLQLVLAAVESPDCDLIVVRDLNIHADVLSDADALQLSDILGDHRLRQHVREPTHDRGLTLDLLMITPTDNAPTSLVSDLQVSDHSVTFYKPVNKPSIKLKTYTSRQWSKFDISQFECKLATSELATTDSNDVDYLFQLYDSTIRTLLDKHAKSHENK